MADVYYTDNPRVWRKMENNEEVQKRRKSKLKES